MPRKKLNLFQNANSELIRYFMGRWKIETAYYEQDSLKDEVRSSSLSELSSELEQVSFTLDEQFDLIWHLPLSEIEQLSLFQTTSFEIDESEITLMGAPDGQSYVFKFTKTSEDHVQLECPAYSSGALYIFIRKASIHDSDIYSFTLLNALKDSYFSDLTIRSSQGQKFMVHRVVLGLICPNVKYREWEMLLSGLSNETLKAALYYIYTCTLPTNIGANVAKELIEMTNQNSKLSHLKELCTSYIESNTLKKRLIELVDSLLHSAEVARQIIMSVEMDDPAKLLYAGKQLAREASIAVCRFTLLCQLYMSNKQDMSKNERREVLEYVQGRIVVFIDHSRELLQLLIAKWESLTDDQKTEIAIYIIPEVERIWDQINRHATHIHKALKESDAKSSQKKALPWKLSMVLQFNSARKDLSRLEKLKREFEKFVGIGEQKRSWFIALSEDEKADKIIRVVQEMGEDLISKLEDIKRKILLANALDWGSYKMGVSIVCSYVSWGLNKLLSFKEPIKPVIQRICHLTGQEEVSSTLVQLGLLSAADAFEENQTPPILPLPSLSTRQNVSNIKNLLAQNCHSLLNSQELSDMQFIVMDTDTPNPSSTTTANPLGATPSTDKEEVISAHRVILAARSEWFSKALQSGMIEDRNRKIIIQDVDSSLFHTFLEYLYGKDIDYDNLSKEEIIELLTVADRYETSSLHKICETQLISRTNNETVFSLLILADQFSTRQLRAHTLRHIMENPDVVMTDIDGYSSLPHELMQEVKQLLSGTQNPNQFRFGHQPKEDDDSGLLELQDNITQDKAIEVALKEFKDIVGDETPDSTLQELLLAADMDVNRAVNFFFGTQ